MDPSNNAQVIGYVIAAILFIGFGVYVFANYRRGRGEVGSEIELAPNRAAELDDELLESSRLDKTLASGLATLAVIAVALPIYWLAEPGRMDGAVEYFDEQAIDRGAETYEESCAACHGPSAVGGVAPFTLTDAGGNFIDQVDWKAPALNTVLTRFSEEEVQFVLDFGRANTPMPAWGLPGGGPFTVQQVDNLIIYLESIQLSADDIATERDAEVKSVCDPDDQGRCQVDDPEFATLGETMFNLGGGDGFAAGAYSCARCHTKGWSYGQPQEPGGGFFGPNLTNGSELRQFPTFEDHVGFVTIGGEAGVAYGAGGLSGAGQMPSYSFNPNANAEGSELEPEQFMYNQDQIEAVVEYERSL